MISAGTRIGCGGSRRGLAAVAAAALGVGAGLLPAGWGRCFGQVVNPVYVDDSPAAGDTFLRVRDHLASGNFEEAVRALQVLLDEMPDRVVSARMVREKAGARLDGGGVPAPPGGAERGAGAPPAADPGQVKNDLPPRAVGQGVVGTPIGTDERDLFWSVRNEVHKVLTGVPELLTRYRTTEEPVAKEKLQSGAVEEVEQSYLLTTSGFEAALRVAQKQMEDARFQAAARTLAELEDHPDRTGPGAAAALALAQQLTRYLNDESVRAMVTRWGGSPAPAGVAWPAAAMISGTSPLDGVEHADLKAVLGKPLRSVSIADGDVVRETLTSLRAVQDSERLPASARVLWVLPTVAGDTLYLNNGVQVSAWDRITLAPKWSVRGDLPAGEDPEQSAANLRSSTRGSPSPEDPTMVTVSGRVAIAPLGVALGTGRWPDSRVVAIDTITGRVKWAVSVADLDPTLAEQSVRGPALISEGTVVLALRASLPDRRMVTLYQAGLDLATGALKWFHLVGSTGALPYRNDPYVAESAVEKNGVVYHADMLGVVSATEAVSGRPVWVRRMPPVASQTWDALSPWQIAEPVIDGDSLVVLSPDHREVVRLDRATGELRGWCATSRFDQQTPRYILKSGTSLAVVFDNRISVVPLEGFESAPAVLTPRLPEPGINGRVSVAGDKLVVPTVEGLRIVDTKAPEAEPELMPLDDPGNALALESQLIVVDDESVHSYLLWEVAEKLLTARMQEDPSDPTSAATLAELAYRAGREDRIIPAADAALHALELKPDAESAEPTRARLFASLHAMVAASLEPHGPDANVDGPRADGATRITDRALLGDLVERMRRAARTPDERLTYLLSRGRLLESGGEVANAMDVYQQILDDEELSSATWSGPRLSTRGELEVTRRMEALIQQNGVGVYAAHDEQARLAAAKLGPEARPGEISRLAMRYPVSGSAAGLWERAAEAYRSAGREHAVVGALESALDAAERIPGGPGVGEVAGRLISELQAREQFAAAGNALKNVMERHPAAVIVMGGAPVDAAQLAEKLAVQVAARQRWPRIGELKNEGVQVLSGWALMEPLMRVRTGVASHGAVLKSSDEIALFAPTEPGEGGATGAGDLAAVWKRPIDSDVSELVRLDSEAAYFFYASSKGAIVEKVAQAPAMLKWQTPLFADVQTGGPGARSGRREMEPRIPTPQDGVVLLTDGVITMDDRTMVFMERQGYATALDTQSGAVLWTARTPLDRVYDAAVVGGTLVVAGDQEVSAGPGERVTSLRPEIAVLEARTGQEVQRLAQRWGTVRWVRLGASGLLIAGCENAIVATDLSRGQVNWVLSDPHLSQSRDAWLFQNSLFILDRERQLWWADAQSGRVSPDALEAPRGRLEGVRRVDASLLNATAPGSSPLVAFSTYQGVVLYDLNGTLKGVDAVGGLDGLIPPVPAQDRMITITTMPEARRSDQDVMYNIYALDTQSSMVLETVPIVLGVPPRSLALLDGRVLVTAGGTTLVVRAPAKDK